jgi:hypothetical protein
MTGKFGEIMAELLYIGPVRYTARVVKTGFESYSDSFDGRNYETMTVEIPKPSSDPNGEWKTDTFKIYNDSGKLKNLPKTGELVDLEIQENYGLADRISLIERSKSGEKVIPLGQFEPAEW